MIVQCSSRHSSFTFFPLSNRASKEGSWEAEKLGTWEVGEWLFAAGVIFFVEDGKRGKLGSWEAWKIGSWKKMEALKMRLEFRAFLF
jgi:hypothetical protein